MIKDIIIVIFDFYDKIVFGTDYVKKITDEGNEIIAPNGVLDVVLATMSMLLTILTILGIAYMFVFFVREMIRRYRQIRYYKVCEFRRILSNDVLAIEERTVKPIEVLLDKINRQEE